MNINKEVNYGVVFVGSGHGYNHINTRIHITTKDDLDSVKSNDLPYSLFESISGAVAFNAQYNMEGGEAYGYEPILHDINNYSLCKAEKSLKLLRKVSKKYDKLRDEERDYKYISSLMRFLLAANVKRVFIRYTDNSVGFVNLNLDDAIYQLAGINVDFENGSV